MAVTVLVMASVAEAQDPLRDGAAFGVGDIAAIKQKAEAGDAKAQVSFARALAHNLRHSEALAWYRKAAEQRDSEAAYQVGNMLLFGATGIHRDQKVPANPTEGFQWTFRAATNFHDKALWNMSKALQRGLGVSTNLVEAYAWLQLFADSPSGSTVGRVELNKLALKLDSAALQEGQRLAAQFKAGNWRKPAVRLVPEGDPRLKLSGITVGGKTPLAVINGKTIAEGESVIIPSKPVSLTIKCVKIETDSVLVSIVGEDTPRTLRLQ